MDNWLLTSQRFTGARERAYTYRLMFDLLVAGGAEGYVLQCYMPTVDQDGWDVAFVDDESERRIQVKTRLDTAGTACWSIQAQLLRPTFSTIASTCAGRVGGATGFEGGVVLVTIDASRPEVVQYSYVDLFILLAHLEGISAAPPRIGQKCEQLLTEIITGKPSKMVPIRRSMFIDVKSPRGLLRCMRLYTSRTQFWEANFLQYLDSKDPALKEIMVECLRKELSAGLCEQEATS